MEVHLATVGHPMGIAEEGLREDSVYALEHHGNGAPRHQLHSGEFFVIHFVELEVQAKAPIGHDGIRFVEADLGIAPSIGFPPR